MKESLSKCKEALQRKIHSLEHRLLTDQLDKAAEKDLNNRILEAKRELDKTDFKAG